MPLRYLNRSNSSTTISAGNSVLFNGSNQYLSIANNAAFNLTGDFTIECWVYAYSFGSYNGVVGRWPNAEGNVANSFVLEAVGGDLEFFFSVGSTLYGPIQGAALTLNIWQHVAAVRSGNTMYIFVNGVMYGSGTSVTQTFNNVASSLTVGGNIAGAGMWDGFISNLRILKGTALYTSNFTPSTSPLTAITNTSLLTCQSATIIDNSTNNFTITNNGAATVSSTVPFTASFAPAPSGMKFGNRNNSVTATQTGKSVQFNGSNQYLSIPRILDNSTDVTIEAWVRVTSASDAYIVAQYVVGSVNRTIFSVNSTLKVGIQIGSTSVNSTAAITLNTWYHVAWVRSGSGANNFSIYINGVRDGQMTYTGTFHNTPTTIGGSNNYDAYGSSYFSGYISNLRILKGTALYTSNFTPPTAPLTAIANTSLLTCNAATIVDGSSNNFTITNNNSATVSSITPFTVASAASTTRVRKVYADAVSSIVTSGLVLNLDASNVSSYPGSGTSWFDLSGNGNTGTLTNGPTFNSANGGSIVFDGSNDYVSSFPTQISGVGSKTVSAWIKINKTSRVGLAGIRDGGSQTGWVFTVNRTTYGNLTYFHTGGSTLEVAAGIITNTWYNVCVTYNLTSTTAILYLNGVQIGSPSTSFTAITPSSFKGVVGNEDSAFSDLFSGNIAQTLIYNRALSASEVLQNYNITKAKFGL